VPDPSDQVAVRVCQAAIIFSIVIGIDQGSQQMLLTEF
jgi:hypothetical protein